MLRFIRPGRRFGERPIYAALRQGGMDREIIDVGARQVGALRPRGEER